MRDGFWYHERTRWGYDELLCIDIIVISERAQFGVAFE
jgi:hypothetical protein